ncbi:DUF3102 domain-containing protein [Clostridium botulinum]|uniref:DUF3102 domain-containing protein n=2 Tax=Clostridium TaxID=1485 RepID=UPI0013C97DDA|nr:MULTISPECIES: DUF3102 domain-containing protein [unclassified Clostridium]NFH99487.1 DUF3102 domain-containing protein [Clostridium botulinum]NFI62178.1 DUF3102 domain-containing protein [Clostridium botulinum]NFJ42616.1 DUF3102 domain-containing protein [Clostridium botulinum]NFJ46513.1 DUF3102 domain-containing protein [Clostridium botulinum]NFK26445.1 DUF3102 domain-containing protein [Clostridium botulinum]
MRRKNIENQNLTEEERNQVQIEMFKQKILQAKTNIDDSIGEIGMCLHSIKEQLPHGEWGKWLEENVDYTPRTAQRYIKAFMFTSALPEELESKINMLGGTKLIELSSCKIEIAEDIVRTNDVKNISLTELKKIIKEKKSELKISKKKNDINVAFEPPKELITILDDNIKDLNEEEQKETKELIEELKENNISQKEIDKKVKDLHEEFENMRNDKKKIICNTSIVSKNDKIKQIIEDTETIIKEIEIRQGYKDDFETTLIARYNAREITLEELNKVIEATKCDLPIFFKEELLNQYIDRNDFYSNYEHYEWDKQHKSTIRYGILDNFHFDWEENIIDHHYYNWEEEQLYKVNHLDNNTYQIAELSDDNGGQICIYKNYKLFAHFISEDEEDMIENIKVLCEYDTNLELDSIIQLYKELLVNLKQYWEEETIRFAKEQEKKKKYNEAYKNWQTLYQPYSMGKYQFEDIWNDEGEIKNFKLWKEMCDFCDKQRKANYERYKNFNYDDWLGHSTKTLSVAEEDKPIYKKMYKKLAFEFHPDKMGGDGHAMQLVNELKQQWGI